MNNTFAKRVFPVPGGPYKSKCLKGALFFFVFAVEAATRDNLCSSVGSSTTPLKASLAKLLPNLSCNNLIGCLNDFKDNLEVSLTKLGLPNLASIIRPANPVPTLALYIPNATIVIVDAAANIFF